MITLLEVSDFKSDFKRGLKYSLAGYTPLVLGGVIGTTAGFAHGLNSMGNDVVNHFNSLPEQDRVPFIRQTLGAEYFDIPKDGLDKISLKDKMYLGDKLSDAIRKQYPYTNVTTPIENHMLAGSMIGYGTGLGAGLYGINRLKKNELKNNQI